MFSTKNGLEYKYDFTAKRFRIAFDFLKRKDLAELPVGWIELGEGVRASVQRYTSFKWDENRFETHEKYFDVQYVIEGMETCGVCALGTRLNSVPACPEIIVPLRTLVARESFRSVSGSIQSPKTRT